MAVTGQGQPRVVSLDLDDTLWPMRPLLRTAEYRLHRWLRVRYPRVVARYSPHQMRAWRLRIAERHPENRERPGWLRARMLEEVMDSCGYPVLAAAEALEVFLAARHDVQLYPDVRQALQRLHSRFIVVALTNGNADLARIGLGAHFHHRLCAEGVGAAKPAAAMYAAVSEATGVDPGGILHVGDCPVNDVAGAAAAGLRTAWINRDGARWPAAHRPADWEVTDLLALVRHLEPAGSEGGEARDRKAANR